MSLYNENFKNQFSYRFEYINEYGHKSEVAATNEVYPDYEVSPRTLMGKGFVNLLRIAGYREDGEYLLTESLTWEELEAVSDFLADYRFNKEGII